MKKIVMFFGLVLFCFAQQEIPTYPGDPGTGDHKGQPVYCIAHDEHGVKKNCDVCDMKCENGQPLSEHPLCKTYCRKGACKCSDSCKMPTGYLKKKNNEIAINAVFRLDNFFQFKALFEKMIAKSYGRI